MLLDEYVDVLEQMKVHKEGSIMNDFYKEDAKGIFTVSELITWLMTNCNGDEHCSGVGGGNVSITVYEDKNRIVFE